MLLLLACALEPTPPDIGCRVVDVDGDGAEGPGGCEPTDCDDANPRVFPGAPERCDGADEDCDGDIDEDPIDLRTWYTDGDGDGYGATPTPACTRPAGSVRDGGDCDDAAPDVFPGAVETCDERDEDCDGTVDEDAIDAPLGYLDEDGDGFGSIEIQACSGLAPGGDCDDAAPDVFPGAPELCDDRDEDCDGEVDEDAIDALLTFSDEDGDGFGGPEVYACAEQAPPGDCDDADPTVFPGASESCDTVDRDCDGDPTAGASDPATWFFDADADGYGAEPVDACEAPEGAVALSGDCDDADGATYPGAPESCDPTDHDCDGDPTAGATDLATWYEDLDGDGFGAEAVEDCEAPLGAVAQGGDCDDGDASVSPAAPETCDRIDQDCDGEVDEDAIDAVRRWVDGDRDRWGDPLAEVYVCPSAPGYADNEGDCDDDDASTWNTCVADCSTLVPTVGDVSFSGTGAGPDMAELCRGYNVIDGDLEISSVSVDDLRHLSCLCEVTGDVVIASNFSLTSLSGLQGLRAIGGSLTLSADDALVTLDGLESLEGIGGALGLSSASLADITALGSLRSLGSLEVLGSALPNLAGLEGLTSLPDGLWFAENSELVDVSALSGVRGPTGAILFRDERKLVSLAGLEGITEADSLTISDPLVLPDLRGLEGLTMVSGDVTIESGNALTRLDGLDGLVEIGGGLTVEDNTRLEDVSGLSALSRVGGTLTVSNVGSLESLAGLTQLAVVGGDLEVELEGDDFAGLEALEEVGGDLSVSISTAGLDGLRVVGGELYVVAPGTCEGLTAIESLGSLYLRSMTSACDLVSLREVAGEVTLYSVPVETGLPALQTAGSIRVSGSSGRTVDLGLFPLIEVVKGDFIVEDSSSLQSILPLPYLRRVDGVLTFDNLDKLVALPEIPSLRATGGLKITSHKLLADLGGLDALRDIDGSLTVQSNSALDDLTPLYGISRVDGSFKLSSNTLISTDEAETFRDTVGVENISGTITISE